MVMYTLGAVARERLPAGGASRTGLSVAGEFDAAWGAHAFAVLVLALLGAAAII